MAENERPVDEVSAAVNSRSIDECPDAVAGALDPLYDLWEAWRSARTDVGVTVKVVDDDRAVSREPDGEPPRRWSSRAAARLTPWWSSEISPILSLTPSGTRSARGAGS